jgi:hypothetical protein
MYLPLTLFGLVCATFAAVGFYDKAQRRRKIAEQTAQQNRQSN